MNANDKRMTAATLSLVVAGAVVVLVLATTNFCGDDGDWFWPGIVGASLLVGWSAFLFAKRPRWSPVIPYVIAVIAIPVALFTFAFLGLLAWASACTN